ncbi:hypothetical protein SAMN05192573_10970 [Mucilaginibacter gossypii]|uniref:Uncharacterized protein n=1 Tax=Mucilaginibacter gossypii TaxID=551996 RepID=A0A1G8BVE2_9SPHI|nr:hypothetical protein SAMN05192573_10970 [Mucilaginibacter gossypii]
MKVPVTTYFKPLLIVNITINKLYIKFLSAGCPLSILNRKDYVYFYFEGILPLGRIFVKYNSCEIP